MTWNKRIIQSLFDKIVYYGDEKVFVCEDRKIKEVPPKELEKPRLIVLGKSHYFETEKTFPFSSLRDIMSAVKTDTTPHSPYGSDLFFIKKIDQVKENTRVNLWFLNKEISTMLKGISPWFIVPETALLGCLNPHMQVIYTVETNDNEILYAHIDEAGGVKSLVGRGPRFDLQWFTRSIGGTARESRVRELGRTDDYLPLFSNALSEMPLKTLFSFLNRDALSLNLNQKGLRSGLLIAAILFFLYTMMSSLVIYHAEKSIREENSALSQSLTELLDKKERADDEEQRQNVLVQNINQYTGKIQIINLLNGILPQGATITNLTISGETAEMRGLAPEASVLLNALSQDPRVKGARFISPLREDKGSGKETFHLTFVFEQGG